MKTLIIGDIHLCTSKNAEDSFLGDWLAEIVNETDPAHVVFAGDTFEISFCTENRDVLASPEGILEAILNLHQPFFDFLRDRSGIRRLTFLVGEHDYLILNKLEKQLKSSFNGKEVSIEEYFYDEDSKLLAIHGHQLDYNLIPSYLTAEVLTDKLTRIFERFIFQDSQKTKNVLSAFEQQGFSFWYAAGNLPDYIDATGQIFGHDPDIYFQELSLLLKSDFFRTWVKDLDNRFNKAMGRLASLASYLPISLLKQMNRPWWTLSQRVVLKRSLSVLRGKVDRTLLNIREDLAINNLVVSHAHRNGLIEFNHHGIKKSYHSVSSPRWYVKGIKNGHLELRRDTGFVMIDNNSEVSYVAARQSKQLPV